jgi:FkbM family methyltransferase
MQMIASSALHSGASIRLKRTRHGTMLYCIHDTYVGRSLDLYGEFSVEETTLFGRLIEPEMTVLDVGANIGVHTLDFAAAAGPKGAVIAFEPQGFLHQILCTNLLLNEIVTVRAIHGGLGRERGQAWIPPIDYGAAGNFGGVSLQRETGGERVTVAPLDSLGLAQCHFVKIDVEGMEEDVIAGGAQTIRKFKPILYVENDRKEKSPLLIRRIADLGYVSYWHFPRYYNAENFYGNPVNVFGGMVSVNMLCVPAGRAVEIDGLERITDPAKHPSDGFRSN